MALTQPFIEMLPSAARTTAGQGTGWWEWGARAWAFFSIIVTAASGTTPQLTVIIESSADAGITWRTQGTSPVITGVSTTDVLVSGQFSELVRVRWTIAGTTPSFTFSVTAGHR